MNYPVEADLLAPFSFGAYASGELPLDPREISEPGEKRSSGEHLRESVVLVVDDDADHRDYCSLRFTMLGCRVIGAPDGDAGFRLATLCRPDLILMDLVMPVSDGVETTHRLRSDSRTRNSRIVGMTNFGASWQQMARTAGCDLVIAKKFLIESFDDVARRILKPGPRQTGSR